MPFSKKAFKTHLKYGAPSSAESIVPTSIRFDSGTTETDDTMANYIDPA